MQTPGDFLRLVPEISRARGWRLYTTDGKRLVDLWQYGGRALLGHTPSGLLRAFKNSAERGLFAPFPHFAEDRLEKALAVLLPGRLFRLYRDETALEKALVAAGFPLAESRPAGAPAQGCAVWRPFLPEAGGGNGADAGAVRVLIPILPLPFPRPAVAAFKAEPGSAFPPSDVISPVLLAAAARAVYDLIASPERGKPCFKNGVSHPCRLRGIYLYRDPASGEDYAALFRRFLEGGFLLPPDPQQPAILPGELSPGEAGKLAGLLRE